MNRLPEPCYKSIILIFALLFFLTNTIAHAQSIIATPAVGTIEACLGSASSNSSLQQITIEGDRLSSNITAAAPPDFEISLNASGGYVQNLTLPQVGGIIYVRSASTAPLGPISGNVGISSIGAAPVNVLVNATIKLPPAVNHIDDQVVNNGDLTAAVNYTGTASLYRWTNDNPAIGIAASGTGNIPPFTAINTSHDAIKANFIVTPAPAGFVFVANSAGSTVSMINIGSNIVKATTTVNKNPNVVLVNPNQREVYVLSSYSNEIQVLDALTGTLIDRISSPFGSYPTNMVTNPSGSLLYVLSSGVFGGITVINTLTHSVIGSLSGNDDSESLAISQDGSRLYFGKYGSPGFAPLSVINAADNTVIADVMTGASGSDFINVTPDGSRILVTNKDDATISVVNGITNTLITNIALTDYLQLPAMSADGKRFYIANQISSIVSVIDVASASVVANIHVGNYLTGCALSKDGKWLYVTSRLTPAVFIINTADNTVAGSIPFPGAGIKNPILSPDGSRLFVTDYILNTVHVINTATNTLITNVAAGANPEIRYNTAISLGNGCDGTPTNFSITVNGTTSGINAGSINAANNTTYGTPSNSSSFTVSGVGLTAGITVTPPPGFEVSIDNVTFSNTVTVGAAGFTGPATVYIRLTGTANASSYSGDVLLSSNGVSTVNVQVPNAIVSPAVLNVTGVYTKEYGDVLTDYTHQTNIPGATINTAGLRNGNTFKSIKVAFGSGAQTTDHVGTYTASVITSDLEGDNGYLSSNYTVNYLPIDLAVTKAPITIKGGNASKNYGTTLTGEVASTNFTVTGLKNNETIGSVDLSYSAGAAATAAPGLYAGSIYPFNPSGGTFDPGNYGPTYAPGDLTVLAAPPPPSPVVVTTGSPSMLQTVYGAPSLPTSIKLSGTNLTANITISAPGGFEISSDNSSFNNTLTLTPASGQVTGADVYIRLKMTAGATVYQDNLTISTSGMADVMVPLAGQVTPAQFTITANAVTKTYGAILNGSSSTAYTATALQNNETVQSVSLAYGPGAAADAPVGNYNGAVIASVATGSFNPANYIINYVPAAIEVKPAPLVITANNASKAFAAPNPVLTVTYDGFVNNESSAQLTVAPVISTTATLTSPVGKYPITVSGALSPNYSITYIGGFLTVYASTSISVGIKIPNTFTPNNDGINDQWTIADLQNYANCDVKIYDRNGQQLYHSVGYSKPWDGTQKDKPLPLGTYYYLIELNDATSARLSGYVTLVK